MNLTSSVVYEWQRPKAQFVPLTFKQRLLFRLLKPFGAVIIRYEGYGDETCFESVKEAHEDTRRMVECLNEHYPLAVVIEW